MNAIHVDACVWSIHVILECGNVCFATFDTQTAKYPEGDCALTSYWLFQERKPVVGVVGVVGEGIVGTAVTWLEEKRKKFVN
mgnify:CR=1 FL=1